jgi:hypothetical protein
MTTSATTNIPAHAAMLPGRKYDHVFFSAIALSLFASVFIGFAHTYYLAGLFSASLPGVILVQQMCGPIGTTSVWMHFAGRVQALLR